MITVCFFIENLGTGGAVKHLRCVGKYMNRKDFRVLLATCDPSSYGHEVMPLFDDVFLFDRQGSLQSWQASTNTFPEAPDEHPLYNWIEEQEVDILVAERSGERQFPLNSDRIGCLKADINIFGGLDPSDDIHRTFCISTGVYNTWSRQMKVIRPERVGIGRVIPLAQEDPLTDQDMREHLGIGPDTVVFGRVGNQWAGDTMNFRAYGMIEDDRTHLIALNVTEDQKKLIVESGAQNVTVLPAIHDVKEMSIFYNTIDVLIHDRGESFGCAIAEAIMHKKPVVTKGYAFGYFTDTNAEEELIQDPEFCAHRGNVLVHYAQILSGLKNDGRAGCKRHGEEFYNRTAPWINARHVVSLMEAELKELALSKGQVSGQNN